MFSKFQIFVLPAIFILFAFYTFIIEEPVKVEKTTVSKSTQLPYKQESKTQITKTTFSNKVIKFLIKYFCGLIKNNIERPTVFTIFYKDRQVLYKSIYVPQNKGRSPPNYSEAISL